MKYQIIFVLLILKINTINAQIRFISTFEQNQLAKADTFWNGKNGNPYFNSAEFKFINNYNADWQSWDGFALSNMKDTINQGFENQYSVISGSGLYYSKQYAVGYYKSTIINHTKAEIRGTYINNTTYAYYAIRDGSTFNKKFGGSTGNDPDYFGVKAYGFNKSVLKDSSVFYLADFRFSDNSKDYILKKWMWWDLKQLNGSDSIVFEFFSSDVGMFGINTPTYFALDNFNGISDNESINTLSDINFNKDTVNNGANQYGGFLTNNNIYFENIYDSIWKSWSGFALSQKYDGTTAGFQNQYSCFDNNILNNENENAFFVAYQKGSIYLPLKGFTNKNQAAFKICNTTYPYLSMKNGDMFSKKFGGTSGNDKDYFRIKFKIYDHNNKLIATKIHYLADFTFDDQSKDYIQNTWQNIQFDYPNDMINKIDFELESSDTGRFGINTPTYFAIKSNSSTTIDIKAIQNQNLSIYPNPASSVLYFKDLTENKNISIYNSNGMLLKNIKTDQNSINIEDLPSGLYFINIDQHLKNYSTKFIKL